MAEGTTMAELIKVGAMQLRFLRTKYDTSGALDMFEVVIPPNSRMPVPHHHRDWEETIYGLEGVIALGVPGAEPLRVYRRTSGVSFSSKGEWKPVSLPPDAPAAAHRELVDCILEDRAPRGNGSGDAGGIPRGVPDRQRAGDVERGTR